MAVKNSTIMSKMWKQGSNDYQTRVPNPTQSTMKQTVDKIFAPMNGRVYNEFVDNLVNRIGETLVHQKEWQNPLAVFKSSRLNYGSTVQEIATKWVQAHSYDDEAETLLKMNRPEIEVAYHTMNRQDRYDITINRDELRQAFLEEYGLNNFVNSILQVPINSDNYDEYRAMLQLIAFYENTWGFYKHQLSAAPDDEATAKEFLKAIRTYAGKLQFPSTLYNAGVINDIAVFADPRECVLLINPQYLASVDVDALASLFHLEKADMPVDYRVVVVDEFPIPDAVALLTTEDFFICKDVEYTTASFYNPQTLNTNYYLHHWSLLSVSPFVPAILFTTAAGTETPTEVQTVASITLTAEEETVKPGGEVQLITTVTGTTDPAGGVVVPNATTYEIKLSEGERNSRTYVDRFGVLHVQKTIADGTVITVTATSSYVNPSGATPANLTDTATVTVDTGENEGGDGGDGNN